MIGVAILMQAFTVGTIYYAFSFWVDPWMVEFNASRGYLAMAGMLANTIGLLLSPFVGRALDRFSIRSIITLGILLFAAGLVGASMATAAWQIVTLYATVMSLAFVCSGVLTGQTLATRWFSRRRGVALGWVTIGTSLGGFFMPPLVSSMFTVVGWRTSNLILAASAVLILLPMVWLVVRNSPEERGLEPEGDGHCASGVDSQQPASVTKWTTSQILTSRTLWILVFSMLPCLIAVNGLQMNFRPYTEDLGISAQNASYLISVLSVVMIGAKLGFGALADRVDHRILLAMVVATVAAAVSLLLTAPSYSSLVVVVILIGAGMGGFLPLGGVILSTRYGVAAFGQVSGIFLLVNAAMGLGGPIAGLTRDLSGSYQPFFYSVLVLISLSAIPIVWLPPPLGADRSGRRNIE